MVAARGGKVALGVVSVVVLAVVVGIAGYLFVFGSEGWATALSLSASAFIFLAFPVLFAILAAVMAKRTGAPGGPWLWAAVSFFFPLAGMIVMLVVTTTQRRQEAAAQAALQTPAIPRVSAHKECRYCGTAIPEEAVTCPNCAAPQ
ncbi:MAG: zinc ribbon domain-containing protein [Gaiellales bacterium]|nr:zinc ribbon domain-containing protein [Gaiellales bacterium]